MADITQGLIEGLMVDTQNKYSNQLGWVIGVLNHHPEFMKLLHQKDISIEDKKKLLDDIIKDKVDPQIYNMILILVSSGSLHLLENIQKQFERIANDKTNALSGTVISAFELNDDMMFDLEDHFSKLFNNHIKLSLKVDPSIIGGIIVTIGDTVFDGSIISKLDNLKKHILQD